MTTAQTIKQLSEQRDDAQARADDLLKELLHAKQEIGELKHFKAGVMRLLRNTGVGNEPLPRLRPRITTSRRHSHRRTRNDCLHPA